MAKGQKPPADTGGVTAIEEQQGAQTFDHSGGAPIAEDKREDLAEKMFWVGLKPDAPMNYVTVPTLSDLKAVNVTKKLSSLDPHPTTEGMHLLSRTRNLVGRSEALCKEEFDAFVEFVKTHSFKIQGHRTEDRHGNVVKSPRCNGVVPTKAPYDSGITRMRRSQADNLLPMADYVWIVPKKTASHYDDIPPTVSEMEAAGRKLEF